MADEPNILQEKPPTLRAAMMNMDPKIALAFFLTTIAALMVVVLLAVLVIAGPNAIDAGTIALIASMIMLFIKMAADANGYQTNSSAGDAKKDETQAVVAGKLADKVAAQPPVAPPIAVVAWWSLLTDAEKATITERAKTDSNIQALIAVFAAGKAEPEHLAALVAAGLLTKERADTFKTA